MRALLLVLLTAAVSAGLSLSMDAPAQEIVVSR